MLVGFGREHLQPPLPFDPQGQVARVAAVHEVDGHLSVTACVIRGRGVAMAIVSADVLAHAPAFARSARRAIATAVGCPESNVLLSASHTHASLWPGRGRKVSGADLERWWPGEREYNAGLPEVYASAARRALNNAVPSRVSWSVGHVPGRLGNRRQRDADGRIVIGWDRHRQVDETVSVLRFDGRDGRTGGTIVGFACHPVVLGHQVERGSSDFVGPLRATVEGLSGGLCLFLQGASGDVQPREALHERRGPEEELGRRVGLEAARAAADADPWPRRVRAERLGRWTPTIVYRSARLCRPGHQPLAVQTTRLRLPLLPAPTVGELRGELAELERRRVELGAGPAAAANALDIHLAWARSAIGRLERGRLPRAVTAEIWAARIGEAIIVGVPAELFGELGSRIRDSAGAPSTLVAGCCNGVLGYVPTASAFAEGGFEVLAAHRVYGAPAAFSPGAGELIVRASARLIEGLTRSPSVQRRPARLPRGSGNPP